MTNPAESRYSPIEGKCLAIAVALLKAKPYVLGCNDPLLATDNKPLVSVFAKSLEDIENTRLLLIAEKNPYVFHVCTRVGPSWFFCSFQLRVTRVNTS